jgi:protein disulfide isomerase
VIVSESESEALTFFGLTAYDLPAAVMAHFDRASMIKLQGSLAQSCAPYCQVDFFEGEAFSEGAIDKFVSRWFSKNSNKKLKLSSPVPKPDSGSSTAPVKVIKSSNFKKLVMRGSKNVMLKFYAPWCGHCKQMAPEYEKLAAKFVGSSDVLIAKVDATAHKLETPIEVKGFPTVLFFPGDDKQNPVKYGGGRDSVSLISFIEEHKTSGPAKKQVRKPKKKTVMKKADKTSGTATPAGRATQSEGAVKKTTKKKSSGARMPKDVVSVVTDDNFDQLIT